MRATRLLPRLAVVLGVVLSTSLVTQTGAGAFSSGQGIAANPWIISEFAAMEGTAVLSGATTVVGSSAATGAAAASAGAVATGASAGMQAVGTVGTLVASLGAAIGLGHLPGLKGIFGDSGAPALPAGGAPAGAQTFAACPNLLYTPGATVSGKSAVANSCAYTGTAPNQTYKVAVWMVGDGYGNIMRKTVVQGGSTTCGGAYLPAASGSPGTEGHFNPTNGTPPTTVTLHWQAYNTTTGCTGPALLTLAFGPVASETNPLRWIESKGNCTHPDGTVTVVTTSSSTFTRAVGATGEQTTPAAPEVICPTGRMLTSATSEVVTEGSTTRVPIMAPYTADPALTSKLVGTDEYADCLTTLCALHVHRLSPDLDCSTIAPGAGHPCRDWSLDAAGETKYQCRYGAHVLLFSTCASLKNAYGASPVLTPNTGTNADTVVTPDVNADPNPGLTPGLNNDGCVPSGIGILNPFWLVKGVGCVLKWAFVPPTGTFEAAQGTISGGWAGNGIGQWGAAVGGSGSALAGMGSAAGSSCEGPAYTIDLPGDQSYPFKPLDACEQPMQGVALVIKLLGTIFVIIAGIKLCARPIMAAFGMDRAV